MTVSEPASTGTVAKTGELDLRRALASLDELLVMSMAMLQRHDVDEVVNVLALAVESVTGCQLVHVTFLRNREWITLPTGELTRPAKLSPQPVNGYSCRTTATPGRLRRLSRS